MKVSSENVSNFLQKPSSKQSFNFCAQGHESQYLVTCLITVTQFHIMIELYTLASRGRVSNSNMSHLTINSFESPNSI